MNELSRMDRHRRRNNGRKKDHKAASGDTVFRSHTTQEDAAEVEVLRRTRSEKYKNDSSNLNEELDTPSRSSTYPSSRVRMSKWFVNSLIVIFILLMAALLFWGLNGAPPLEEIF